ncbi:MAG: hypothetical protein GY834_02805 [Bacteroidetes bacterium]|nr:hypothetical protein [Bacteroidota bacterium]
MGIINCEKLSFSEKLSSQRIAKVEALLGSKVVTKMVAFALFLLGANKTAIASTINMPIGSLKSLILAIKKRGLAGIEDQRRKTSTFKPSKSDSKITTILISENSGLNINFEPGNLTLHLPDSNPDQKKVVLLSLLNSKFLNKKEVGDALNLSVDRIGKLARKLQREDVKGILDNRQGQKLDYVFKPEIKGELIHQFVLELVNNNPASAQQIANNLKERCDVLLSPRSILNHMNNLGLSHIKTSLRIDLTDIKKKSSDS